MDIDQQGEYRHQARDAEANREILERVAARADLREAEAAFRTLATDPTASAWLREAAATALERDPVDAANDAEALASLLNDRAAAILRCAAAGLDPAEVRQ